MKTEIEIRTLRDQIRDLVEDSDARMKWRPDEASMIADTLNWVLGDRTWPQFELTDKILSQTVPQGHRNMRARKRRENN